MGHPGIQAAVEVAQSITFDPSDLDACLQECGQPAELVSIDEGRAVAAEMLCTLAALRVLDASVDANDLFGHLGVGREFAHANPLRLAIVRGCLPIEVSSSDPEVMTAERTKIEHGLSALLELCGAERIPGQPGFTITR